MKDRAGFTQILEPMIRIGARPLKTGSGGRLRSRVERNTVSKRLNKGHGKVCKMGEFTVNVSYFVVYEEPASTCALYLKNDGVRYGYRFSLPGLPRDLNHRHGLDFRIFQYVRRIS